MGARAAQEGSKRPWAERNGHPCRISKQMQGRTELTATHTDSLSDRLFHFTRQLEGVDRRLIRVFVPWVARHPRYLPGFIRLARAHSRSRRVRAQALAKGVRVPPFLILSVTTRAICDAPA